MTAEAVARMFMNPIDPIEVERRLERLEATSRETGLRLTHQRIEIFREVAQTGEHPDAEMILKRIRERMPTVSHDTVYRTLASLEKMGLLSRVDLLGGRTRYDANSDDHHHFACTECGRISDVYVEEEIPLPEELDNLGHAESVHLQIRGICNHCRNT